MGDKTLKQWLKDGYPHLIAVIHEPRTFLFDCLKLLSPIIGLFILLLIAIFILGYYVGGIKPESENKTLTKSLNSLEGELKDAKQDRDKYQYLLAPFEALALKIYTNVPISERIELLPNQLNEVAFNISNILNSIQSDKPSFKLFINGAPVTNGSVVSLKENRELKLSVYNSSSVTAEGLMIDFSTPTSLTTTNVICGDFWKVQPPSTLLNNGNISTNTIGYHWSWKDNDINELGSNNTRQINSLVISTSYTYPVVVVAFQIYSSHSEKQIYNITLTF